MAWQKTRIEVPEDLTPQQREEAANQMVDLMAEKAQNGEGIRRSGDRVRPRTFPAYTQEYIKFKGQSHVDLVLSGDMLASLDVLSHKKGSVLIGFENGSKANAKAEGNITGSYGRSPNPQKSRNFLGLMKSEINAIVRSVRRDE
jgi:hypothetical protein